LRLVSLSSQAKGREDGKLHLTPAEAAVGPPRSLYVRCNYCGAALPLSSLRRTDSGKATWLQTSSWLTRDGPVVRCCPACRRAGMKCYVCMMSLGVLNPYLEIKRQKVREWVMAQCRRCQPRNHH
jgi:hypothetical protein